MIKKLEIYDSILDETREYEKYYGRLFRNIQTSQPRPFNEIQFNFGYQGELIKHTDINFMIQKLKDEYIMRINFFKQNKFFDTIDDRYDEYGGNQIFRSVPAPVVTTPPIVSTPAPAPVTPVTPPTPPRPNYPVAMQMEYTFSDTYLNKKLNFPNTLTTVPNSIRFYMRVKDLNSTMYYTLTKNNLKQYNIKQIMNIDYTNRDNSMYRFTLNNGDKLQMGLSDGTGSFTENAYEIGFLRDIFSASWDNNTMTITPHRQMPFFLSWSL